MWRPSPADGPTAWWPERPGGSSAWPGFRKTPDFPVIQARLDSMADQVTVEGCRVQVTYRTLFPAMERNAANHSAYLRAAEAAELLGWEPEEIADPTATDGAYLSTYGVPTVDALSAIAEQIHTTEERVRIPPSGTGRPCVRRCWACWDNAPQSGQVQETGKGGPFPVSFSAGADDSQRRISRPVGA